MCVRGSALSCSPREGKKHSEKEKEDEVKNGSAEGKKRIGLRRRREVGRLKERWPRQEKPSAYLKEIRQQEKK